MRCRVAVLLVSGLAGTVACGGSDSFKRPEAEPGRIVTIVDADTPELGGGVIGDLDVGPDGTIYLALFGAANRVVAVPPKGKPKVLADEADEDAFPRKKDFEPEVLSVDPKAGTIYVGDQAAGLLLSVGRDGGVGIKSTAFSDFNLPQSSAPPGRRVLGGHVNDIAFDPTSGGVYIADPCQIALVAKGGSEIVAGGARCGDAETQLSPLAEGVPPKTARLNAAGMAVDPRSGDLLLARVTPEAGEVYRLSKEGKVSRVYSGAGEPTSKGRALDKAELYKGGLAVASSGDVYFADPVRGRVVRVKSDGSSEVLAEIGANPLSGANGGGVKGKLVRPGEVGVDAEGNVFVSAYDEPVVQVIGSR